MRTRVAESSCGLRGIDNLEVIAKPLPPVAAHEPIQPVAIFKALDAIRDHQPGNRATGGMHAAAFVRADGEIIAVREDVGRHNALDKLIGAMAQFGHRSPEASSSRRPRCSYEIVEKSRARRRHDPGHHLGPDQHGRGPRARRRPFPFALARPAGILRLIAERRINVDDLRAPQPAICSPATIAR